MVGTEMREIMRRKLRYTRKDVERALPECKKILEETNDIEYVLQHLRKTSGLRSFSIGVIRKLLEAPYGKAKKIVYLSETWSDEEVL